MNQTLFSTHGRLTRRDYALTIGALGGCASLLTFAALSALLPVSYFVATMFFRETATAFWILLITGIILILTCAAALVPLCVIPATVRRLHDIGRSGWFAFPLVFMSILPLGLPTVVLLSFLNTFGGMGQVPLIDAIESADDLIAVLALSYIILCVIAVPTLAAFAAYVFLKKSAELPNRYGDIPVEEEIPSVRAAFFAATGQIDRAHFVFRALVVIAAAGIVLPTLGQSVLYPLAIIGKSLGLVPSGAEFFALFIGGAIYPLATLPLVLQRLQTLGHAKWEALLVYAALLPNLLCTAAFAHLLSRPNLVDESTIGDAIIEEFIIFGTANDTIFIALWILCGILSLIGIVRLLKTDE